MKKRFKLYPNNSRVVGHATIADGTSIGECDLVWHTATQCLYVVHSGGYHKFAYQHQKAFEGALVEGVLV